MPAENRKLDKEEKQILKDFEDGNTVSVDNIEEEMERYRQYAKNTLEKRRSINIRLTEKDYHKLKAIAAEKGMPYQTLISSLLHQYTQRTASTSDTQKE